MTREARLLSGIILITVPTIQYGGYFLLTSLVNKASVYMDNPLRQNFFRAGHAARRSYRNSLVGLPSPGGCGGSSLTACVACSSWSAAFGDSYLRRILLFYAPANGYST